MKLADLIVQFRLEKPSGIESNHSPSTASHDSPTSLSRAGDSTSAPGVKGRWKVVWKPQEVSCSGLGQKFQQSPPMSPAHQVPQTGAWHHSPRWLHLKASNRDNPRALSSPWIQPNGKKRSDKADWTCQKLRHGHNSPPQAWQ